MPENKKNIYVLGTCRAFDLSRAACNGSSEFFLLNRADVFLHTTKEILNVIDYQTRIKVPKEYEKYLTMNAKMMELQKDADLFVIEISSNRCVEFNGNYFKLINNDFPKAREHIHLMSEIEIINDMKIIARKLNKPIIFVSHINIINPDGKPVVPQREFMSNIMKKGSLENSQYFFNPATYIDVDWPKYVDKEIYHYTTFGKKAVGKHFNDYLRRVAQNEKW